MEYFDLINQTELKFYKSFTPTKDFNLYKIQASIISSSILLLLLEKAQLKNSEEIKIVKRTLSKEIDQCILADNEIIKYVRSVQDNYFREQDLQFASLAIIKTGMTFKKLDISFKEGTLKDVIPSLQTLFYATYIKPLDYYDSENYFGRWVSEFMKYKEVFLQDYIEHTEELRTKLLSVNIL